MKRFALTLPVIFAMVVLAQAQVKLNIQLYPIQTIEFNQDFLNNRIVEEVNTFGTTHYIVNKMDHRNLEFAHLAKFGQPTRVYTSVEIEPHMADVVYSIEPL